MELTVVLALLGIVLPVMYSLFFFAQSSWTRTSAEARVLQDARGVLLRLDNEIRGAQKANEASTPVGHVSAPTSTTAKSDLVIYTDVTGDGKPEKVSYRMQSGALQRRVEQSANTAYPYSYSDPNTWETIVATMVLSTPFQVTENTGRYSVAVRLEINDAAAPLVQPVVLTANITARNRG